MTTSEMVRQLCKESRISLSELARRVGQSPQNFSKKLQRETLTLEELNQIGDVLGVSYEQTFVLSSGKRISTGLPYSGAAAPVGGISMEMLPADHPLHRALMSDFSTIIYVDAPTGRCTFYSISPKVQERFGKMMSLNPDIRIISSLLLENYVCEEEKAEIEKLLDMNTLRFKLESNPVISHIFKCNQACGGKYYELRIIKIGDSSRMQGAALVAIDRDKMIREKIETTELNERFLAVTDSLADNFSFVASVDLKTDNAWICTVSNAIRNLYGNIDRIDVSFRSVLVPVLLRSVHPEDRERVENALNSDVIRSGLAESLNCVTSFRYKYGERYYFAEMRVSRFRDGFNPNLFVLSFFNRDEEIRSAQRHRDELIEARNKAECVSKAKSDFLGGLSRSLRNSLKEVIGYTELSTRNLEDSAKVSEYLEKAGLAEYDLMEVVNGIAALGRAESARIGNTEGEDNMDLSVLQGKRVLLAEDIEINRQIAGVILSENGMEFDCAANGEEAVELYTSKPARYYDFIMMDQDMPVMNGFDAAKIIRDSEVWAVTRTPVIALTTGGEDSAIKMDIVSDAQISKPIDVLKLFGIMKDLTE